MTSATFVIDDPQWSTGDETLNRNKIARLFADMFQAKSVESASEHSGFQEVSAEAVQDQEIGELSRQWRSQEVLDLLEQIGQSHASTVGAPIVDRLHCLRDMVKEEEGPEAEISPDSLRGLLVFLRLAGDYHPPQISLTPEGDVYLRWKAGKERLFSVHIQNDKLVRFVAFCPNPRHPDITDRFSGTATVDTVLYTADKACSVLEWISE